LLNLQFLYLSNNPLHSLPQEFQNYSTERQVNYFRTVLIEKRLVAIKSSLVGLCIDVIALNISTFKNLDSIPLELREKIGIHLKDKH